MITARHELYFPVAGSTGAIALLPETEAQAYAMQDFQAQEDGRKWTPSRAAAALMDRFRLRDRRAISFQESICISPLAERDRLIGCAIHPLPRPLYTLLHRDNLFSE